MWLATERMIALGGDALPAASADERVRWNLAELHAALDERRRELQLSWTSLASVMGCTPNRLTNLRTARLADLGLVMQLTQWLKQPAARFVHATDW